MNWEYRIKWMGVWLLVFLLALCYVFAKFQGGFASWFLFYALLVFNVYEAVVLAAALPVIIVKREVDKKWYASGASVETGLEIIRRFPLPLPWLIVTDYSPKRIGYSNVSAKKTEKNFLLFPWFSRKLNVHYILKNMQRGIYRWDAMTIQSGDLFGFIRVYKRVDTPEEVVVYPRYQSLYSWKTFGRRGLNPRPANLPYSGDENTVFSVRDYVHGDKLSKIHWKASARGIDWKTKEFESHSANQYLFLLDTELSKYRGQELEHRLERAIETVASLCYTAMQNHLPFTVAISGSSDSRRSSNAYHFSAHRHHFVKTLHELAAVVPSIEKASRFSDTVAREINRLRRGQNLVCVTHEVTEELANRLKILAKKQIGVQLIYVLPRDGGQNYPSGFLSLQKHHVGCFTVGEDGQGGLLLSKWEPEPGGERHYADR